MLTTIILIFTSFGFSWAQTFPDVFAGTWCDTLTGIYEHWEKTGPRHLKGYSYEIKNGEKVISEYIEIGMKENKLVYTVSVKNQNNEKPVSFLLSTADTVYTFVNLKHDFPTFIRYEVLSTNQIKATVGNASRSFTLNYHRIK